MSKKALVLAHTAYHLERFCKRSMLLLKRLGYEVHIAADFGGENPMPKEKLAEFERWLSDNEIASHRLTFTKLAANLSKHLASYRQCRKLFEAEHFDLMHCHTPIGAAVARLAAKGTGMKVIYTAHGFHFFGGAPLKNWLLYYTVEKLCSRYTDVLVTINHEDYERAKRKLRAKSTEYVPGIGIDLSRFEGCRADRTRIRQELGLTDEDICLLSIGELSPRKNHRVVLDALEKTDDPHVKYIICGMGQLEAELRARIAGSNLRDRVQLLSFRSDIPAVCGAADIFVFPSLQEGLPVALMEAMAAGLPCIVSRIRGNVDLIEDEGGIIVSANSSEDYAAAIGSMTHDIQQIKNMSENNLKKIRGFTSETVDSRMEEIYLSV